MPSSRLAIVAVAIAATAAATTMLLVTRRFVELAAIGGFVALIAAATRRPVRSLPPVAPATPPARSAASPTLVAWSCPRCGGIVQWVSTFAVGWCARCGRQRRD